MSSKRVSLAQQIAQLEEAAPVDFDPEDALVSGADLLGGDAWTKNLSAAREHYVEVGQSSLRRSDISGEKYEGVKTSRKSLVEESDEESREEEGEENRSEDEYESAQGDPLQTEEEEGITASESGSEGTEAEGDTFHHPLKWPHGEEEESVEDMSATLKRKREEDAIWDALLDARIRMQKAVAAANRLPKPSDMDVFLRQPECQESLDKMLREALLLSDELSDLQGYLLTKNDSVSVPPSKRQKLNQEESPDYNKQLEDATTDAVAIEHAIHPFLVQTLTKWSAKIQAVAPSVLLPSNRNAFSKGRQQAKSVVELIDETNRNHDKLVARTRIRRGKDKRITVSEETEDEDEANEEDSELFDDTDFYQQLLRDIIDSRSSGGGGVDDWMTIQKEKKAKKKVDTKASKGRKIRYQVHEKLQNFMVPVPVIGAWHEEQIDELFASLLGKGFEGAGGVEDVPDSNMAELESRLDNALLTGFKVFG
ncbi:hypothetical protein AX17_005338 [Amanita inopinata Kibby_2008]|nr:hypothetical protein AX17_005338 [Amanita inopinata Kibby_2008]